MFACRPVTGAWPSVETVTFCAPGLALPTVSLKETADGLTRICALGLVGSVHAPFQNAAATHRTRAAFNAPLTAIDAIRSTFRFESHTLGSRRLYLARIVPKEFGALKGVKPLNAR